MCVFQTEHNRVALNTYSILVCHLYFICDLLVKLIISMKSAILGTKGDT